MIVQLYDTRLELTDAMIDEGRAKAFFTQESERVYTLVRKQYWEYGKLDEVVKYMPAYVDSLYMLIAKKAANQLNAEGIYTVTPDRFLQQMFSWGKEFDGAISKLADQFFALTNEKQMAEDYREYRKDSRARIVGGGFGLGNAIEGMAVAGSINLVTGLAHSVFNVFDGILTNSNISTLIDQVYRRQDSVESLALAASGDVVKMWPLYFEAHGYDFPADASYTSKDCRDAVAIIENVKANRIQTEYLKGALTQALQKMPEMRPAYALAYKHLGNPNHTLSDYAELFHINIDFSEDDKSDALARDYLGDAFEKLEREYRTDKYYIAVKKAIEKKNGDCNIEWIADAIYNLYEKENGDSNFIGHGTFALGVWVQRAYDKWANLPPDDNPLYFFHSTTVFKRTTEFIITDNNLFYNNENGEEVGHIPVSQIKSFEASNAAGKKSFIINGSLVLSADDLDTDKFFEVYRALKMFFLMYDMMPASKRQMPPFEQRRQGDNTTSATACSTQSIANRPSSATQQSTATLLNSTVANKWKAVFVTLLKNNPKYVFDGYIYYLGRDDKSNKKISSATAAYARNLHDGEVPCICCDVTVMGGAEDGFLITNQGVYIRNPHEEAVYFSWNDEPTVETKGMFVLDLYVNGIKLERPSGFVNDDIKSLASLFQRFVDLAKRRKAR